MSVNLELSQEAALRMQQAISTGETVSFGPAEIGKVESDFFQLLGMPNTLTSLTVGPPADLLAKRLRLRVTFAANGETQEFPLVEFKPRRSGADEIELESCSPPLPVQLRITLPVKSGGGRLNLAYEYAGHDIRKVHKAHRALHLMHHGGTITLFDLDEDAHTGTMHLSIPGDAFSSPEIDKFLDDLLEIAQALKTTIIWKRPTFKDAANAAAVRDIIHTGSHLVPARSLTMNLTPAQLTIAEEALSRGEGLRFTSQAAPDIATILGQQLDLGECELLIRANELRRCHAADTGSVSVELMVTEPPCYRFLRFVPNQPDNVK